MNMTNTHISTHNQVELFKRFEKIPQMSKAIEHLKQHAMTMNSVYNEIYDCYSEELPRNLMVDIIIETITFYDEQSIAMIREQKIKYSKVNKDIIKHAKKLANLITERSRLKNQTSISCESETNIINLIEIAGSANLEYNNHVSNPLKKLNSKYDPSYWPPLEDLLLVIGTSTEEANIVTNDAVTGFAISSSRPSKKDTLNALFQKLDQSNNSNEGILNGNKLHFSDKSMAEIMNCAIDESGEVVNDIYVKSARQSNSEQDK